MLVGDVFIMLKILVLLIFLTVVSAYDTCRQVVKVTPGPTCGQQQTMYNEGECLCCYYDTVNIPTIGVGFNLKRKDAAEVMAKYGLNISAVLQDCIDKTTLNCLTDADAKDIFNTISYPEFEPCVDAYAPGLPLVKRAAVIDVAFAGCATLNKFVKMQTALKNKDWETAGTELKNSQWCKQVGTNRCNSDYNCIVGCTGQSCGSFTATCSSNNACYCFKTSIGTGFCAENYYCNQFPGCTSCSTSNSVCIVDSCCEEPICIPLSLGKTCTNPPSVNIFKAYQSKFHSSQKTLTGNGFDVTY